MQQGDIVDTERDTQILEMARKLLDEMEKGPEKAPMTKGRPETEDSSMPEDDEDWPELGQESDWKQTEAEEERMEALLDEYAPPADKTAYASPSIMETINKVYANERDKARIDFAFALTFDQDLVERLRMIRQAVWNMLGLYSTEVLPAWPDAYCWMEFYRANSHLRYDQLGRKTREYVPIKEAVPPHLLVPWLGAIYRDDPAALKAEQEMLIHLLTEMWQIGVHYNIIPPFQILALHEEPDIDRMWSDVLDFVLMGTQPSLLPRFRFRLSGFARYPMKASVEAGKRVREVLRGRAFLRSLGEWTKPKGPDLTADTRIRTWAIYFLSDRGGGARNDASAVRRWNLESFDKNKEVERTNYRQEVERLLGGATNIA